MMNLPLNNIACNIMIDLGLTDKILVRDQLIRILKQESFPEDFSGLPGPSKTPWTASDFLGYPRAPLTALEAVNYLRAPLTVSD